MSAAIATEIAAAAVAALSALNLGYGGTPFPTPDRRKTPSLPQGENPPRLVVSIGAEGEYRDITAAKRLVSYPLAVTIVTNTGNLLGDDDPLRLLAETIRQTLAAAAPWTGVTGFNQVDAAGPVPFNTTALAQNLNYRIVTFTVQTLESRT